MGFKPGNKEGKGRPPGSKNKRRSIEDVCLEAGIDPFKEMAKIATNPEDANYFQALKELAQYLEPKKKAMEVSGSLDMRVQQELEGLMGLTEEQLVEMLKKELK